jgi:hypothetical protein
MSFGVKWAILLLIFTKFLVADFVDQASMPDVGTTVRRHDAKTLRLVMSDEFNEHGRGFGPGEDAFFEAVSKPDDSNQGKCSPH